MPPQDWVFRVFHGLSLAHSSSLVDTRGGEGGLRGHCIYVFVMYLLVRMLYAHACVDVCVCACAQRRMSGIPLQQPLPYFLEMGTLTEPRGRLAASRTTSSPELGLQVPSSSHWTCCPSAEGFAGPETYVANTLAF